MRQNVAFSISLPDAGYSSSYRLENSPKFTPWLLKTNIVDLGMRRPRLGSTLSHPDYPALAPIMAARLLAKEAREECYRLWLGQQPSKSFTDNIFGRLHLLHNPKRAFVVTIGVRPTGNVFGGLVQCAICELDQQGRTPLAPNEEA